MSAGDVSVLAWMQSIFAWKVLPITMFFRITQRSIYSPYISAVRKFPSPGLVKDQDSNRHIDTSTMLLVPVEVMPERTPSRQVHRRG
jgi:hypothetical protein